MLKQTKLMENKLWNKLISNWCESEGRYGLTIPYLIGAQKLINPSKLFTIANLITEISNSDLDKKVILSFCDDLNDLILGFHRENYPFIGQLTGFGSLLIWHDELEDLDNLEILIEKLETIYESQISRQTFSKNIQLGTWHEFDEADESKIRAISEKNA